MLEKPQNLRDALELIKMLEQLFSSLSRTNEQVPWRGIELTLRQAALSIVNSMEANVSLTSCCTSQSVQSQGSFCAQGDYSSNKPLESLSNQIQAMVQADDKDSGDIDTGKFRSRPTVIDRVQSSPVSGYKSKSFSQE